MHYVTWTTTVPLLATWITSTTSVALSSHEPTHEKNGSCWVDLDAVLGFLYAVVTTLTRRTSNSCRDPDS